MATIPELPPLLMGPTPIFDSASSRVSLRLFFERLEGLLQFIRCWAARRGVDSDADMRLGLFDVSLFGHAELDGAQHTPQYPQDTLGCG